MTYSNLHENVISEKINKNKIEYKSAAIKCPFHRKSMNDLYAVLSKLQGWRCFITMSGELTGC
jgi:hypothetical protein